VQSTKFFLTNRSRILDNSNRQAQLVLDSFSSISPLYYWAARIDIRAFFCSFFAPEAGETPERDCTEKTSPPLPGTAKHHSSRSGRKLMPSLSSN
jgi:hypothetical protein